MKSVSKKKTGSPRSKKSNTVKMETIKKDEEIKELKHDLSTSELEDQLILCFKTWTINTAFISATFATLLGLSMSFLMVVAYNIVERDKVTRVAQAIGKENEMDDIMYILSIGAWSVWAWVLAYIVLFIVFMIPKNKAGYWVLWVAYMLCGLIILVTASMAVAKLNTYSETRESDAIVSAKYVCTVTIFISAFFVFLVLTVGLTLLMGTSSQAMKYLNADTEVKSPDTK